MDRISRAGRVAHQWKGLAACVVVLAGLVSACGSGSAGSKVDAASSGMRTITIAEPFTSTLNSALLIADGKGYFADHNIKIKLVSVSGGAGLQTTLGGSADIALCSAVLPLTALAQHQQFKVFAATGDGFPETVIANTDAYKKSGLTESSSLKDKMEFLAGKPFGVSSPTGSTVYEMKYLFKLAGLPESDFKPVVLGSGPGILAALKQGKVIGGSIGSPYPEVASDDGYATRLINVTGGEVPELQNLLSLVFAATPEFYKNNADLISDFTAALAEGQKYVYENQADAADYVWSNYFKESPKTAVVSAIANQIKGESIAQEPQVSKASAEKLVDFMKATGQTVPDNWTDAFPGITG